MTGIHVAPGAVGPRPKVAMVFFDEETERICDELGYDLILPSAELREHLDSKLVTTRLGNEVGAAERAEHPDHCRGLSTSCRGGDRRPAWAPTWWCRRRTATPARPPSSSTTRPAGRRTQQDIVGNEIKVMKRINNRPVAVEAVLTRNGTIVGPFMTELTGHPELTPV